MSIREVSKCLPPAATGRRGIVRFLALFAAMALLPLLLPAQEMPGLWIEGRILDSAGKKPLPYATIYNESTQKGAISNLDGHFRLSAHSAKDVIVITFIGFKKARLPLQEKQTFYEILLEEHAEYLDEISVVASRSSDWYDLLNACRKNQTQTAASAKAYYELKSRINQQQIELVEGFYNARISGYDLKKLDLKAGRLAVQPYEERLFVSLESSRAITMLQLFEPNPLFPKGPLELSRKQLKKDYSIALSKKYKNENLDSVYVLEYTPHRRFRSFLPRGNMDQLF
jgi:hypothetical protein